LEVLPSSDKEDEIYLKTAWCILTNLKRCHRVNTCSATWVSSIIIYHYFLYTTVFINIL
jgi:hypothetical protein